MQRYIATRLLYALGALLAVTTIAFFLMRVAPGGRSISNARSIRG